MTNISTWCGEDTRRRADHPHHHPHHTMIILVRPRVNRPLPYRDGIAKVVVISLLLAEKPLTTVEFIAKVTDLLK